MSDAVEVGLPQGTLRGLRTAGISRFSGIPYGQAPLGPLRFAPPEPARWSGQLDVTGPAPIAPQLPSRLRDAMGDFIATQDEDCLRLTIWTPGTDAARRPVVIWLHGGAWQSGGILPWYDGARLAAQGDVVVVAVSYRLAALGWLTLPGGTPNAGLLDQELAVDWVIKHIAAFGGDPTALTLMGQSAGASSICAMLARQPRFSRAILQSAALGRGWRSAAQSEKLAQAYMNACGVRSLDEARELPVSTLLAAQQHPVVLQALQDEGSGRSLFAPVRDGAILPEDMDAALARAVTHADVLVSYTRDEMAAFPGQGVNAASAALGDEFFDRPARAWAANAASHGRQSWLARFDVAPTARFGACHCIELPFVFGNLDAFAHAPMLRGLSISAAASLSQQTQRAWIAFIRGQSPGWLPAPHQHVLTAH